MRDDAAIPALLPVLKEPGLSRGTGQFPFPLKEHSWAIACNPVMTHMETLISLIKEQCPGSVSAFRVLYGNHCYTIIYIYMCM